MKHAYYSSSLLLPVHRLPTQTQEQFAHRRAISVVVGGRESDAVLTTPQTANRMADALAEARLRLLTVLKHVYWGSFQSGLLSAEGIRYVVLVCVKGRGKWGNNSHPHPAIHPPQSIQAQKPFPDPHASIPFPLLHPTAISPTYLIPSTCRAFERNVALLVANPSEELDEWTTLEQHVLLPLRAAQAGGRWRRLPIVGACVAREMHRVGEGRAGCCGWRSDRGGLVFHFISF